MGSVVVRASCLHFGLLEVHSHSAHAGSQDGRTTMDKPSPVPNRQRAATREHESCRPNGGRPGTRGRNRWTATATPSEGPASRWARLWCGHPACTSACWTFTRQASTRAARMTAPQWAGPRLSHTGNGQAGMAASPRPGPRLDQEGQRAAGRALLSGDPTDLPAPRPDGPGRHACPRRSGSASSGCAATRLGRR